MDMVDNEAWLLNARYVGRFDWGLLDARAFYHSTKHKMDILEDKQPGICRCIPTAPTPATR